MSVIYLKRIWSSTLILSEFHLGNFSRVDVGGVIRVGIFSAVCFERVIFVKWFSGG